MDAWSFLVSVVPNLTERKTLNYPQLGDEHRGALKVTCKKVFRSGASGQGR